MYGNAWPPILSAHGHLPPSVSGHFALAVTHEKQIKTKVARKVDLKGKDLFMQRSLVKSVGVKPLVKSVGAKPLVFVFLLYQFALTNTRNYFSFVCFTKCNLITSSILSICSFVNLMLIYPSLLLP